MTTAENLTRDFASQERDELYLESRSWDRIFVWGGALLVPIPILTYYLCQALGLSVGASEDIVTLLVMVFVGGPHVVATYTRTYMEPRFRREDRFWFFASLGVIALVTGAAIASAFFDVRIFGFPPIYFVLTFFFFFAGLHIVQQSSYVARCYDEIRQKQLGALWRRNRLWNAVDYIVMLGCLYPVSIFRMSMIDAANPTSGLANPDALATQIVVSLSGSASFADEYVFRIGRVAPILPEFMTHPAMWMLVSVGFFAALGLFAFKSWREAREGMLNRPKFMLISATVTVGIIVPIFPNLDSAFQGFNAWHSFQYLGLLWLMNRRSLERGEISKPLVRKLSEPRSHMRFYLGMLSVTLLGIAVFFGVAYLIQAASAGQFVLFGHDTPPIDPQTGTELYRPGALLLAYYMVGFSFLLVHYLHDGVFFFRTRYLTERSKPTG
jgi:hypothetical protein